jgi:uroporphyrin-III C-methyltransferase/precorrin-2 dehydrogenase/sirohydrochlorin ferrochelatase/uroporphyrin-III C-methyltransferase
MVHLVGAGPGDPELLTIKALRLLQQADVVVYDRLVSSAILDLIPAGIKRIYVGKASGHHHFTQDEINELLVRLANANRKVVRLKGGDPYIFGRGGEEVSFLQQHGIHASVVPGITAASAVSYADIPLTYRGIANGVTLVTGHMREDLELALDWQALVNTGTTLVLYMGLHHLPEICQQLVAAGMPADMPAALIENCSLPGQRRHITRLELLADDARRHAFKPPTLVVIGHVVSLAAELSDWSILSLAELEPAAHV